MGCGSGIAQVRARVTKGALTVPVYHTCMQGELRKLSLRFSGTKFINHLQSLRALSPTCALYRIPGQPVLTFTLWQVRVQAALECGRIYPRISLYMRHISQIVHVFVARRGV